MDLLHLADLDGLQSLFAPMPVVSIHPHFDGQLPRASWPRLAPFLIDCLAEAELAEAVGAAVAEVAGLEAGEAVDAVGGGRNLAAAAQGRRQREMADQLGPQEN